MRSNVERKVEEVFCLRVSQRKDALIYCGMPTKDTFSLSWMGYTDAGAMFSAPTFGPNCFYPITQKRVRCADKEYEVVNCTPEEIQLRRVK